ncbi:MAG: tetratricopeptide repeat protein [Armatimonadota bacterium]
MDEESCKAVIEEFLWQISEDPDDFSAWLHLGDAYAACDRIEDAIQAYQMAMSLTPRFSVAYLRLGAVLERLQRYDEAIALYREAIKFDKEFLIQLGALYQYLGRYQEAAETFCTAIDECAHPRETCQILLGGLNTGRYLQALETLSLLQQCRPNSPRILYALDLVQQ